MILKEIFYGLQCDRCGEVFENSDGYSFESEEQEIITHAYDYDWAELNRKHYCDKCYTINEETDEIKVKPEWPAAVKSTESFVEKVLKHKCKVIEDEESFVIRFYDYSVPVGEHCLEWIKHCIGEKLIGIERENMDRMSNYKYLISIKK